MQINRELTKIKRKYTVLFDSSTTSSGKILISISKKMKALSSLKVSVLCQLFRHFFPGKKWVRNS